MSTSRRPPVRSLADDLRTRPDAELAQLVTLRPDLVRPVPADLTSLAARASTRASVQRAVESLDRAGLAVLEAAVVLAPVTDAAELAPALGHPRASRRVRELVERLRVLALLWSGETGLQPVRTVLDLLGPHIAGLGPTYAELIGRGRTVGGGVPNDGAAVEDRLRGVQDGEQAVLDRLAWGPPAATVAESGATAQAVSSLAARGLLVVDGDSTVVLPREVAMALRGGRIHRSLTLVEPVVARRDVEPQLVDRMAGGAAHELLVLTDEVAAAWSERPPRVLRSGGMAVRDFDSLTTSLDLEPHRAAMLLEAMVATDLLADDGEVAPVWAPTTVYDEWTLATPGEQWARVASAWLGSTRAPHRVGARFADLPGPVGALGPDVHWPPIRTLRREVLDVLASVPEAQAISPDDVCTLLQWHRPSRPAAVTAEVVQAVLAEAAWLGLIGRGALSTPGRELLSGATDGAVGRAAEQMGRLLPAPVDHVLLQGDLTAIAPGPLEANLATFMRLAADVESRGVATVFRFTDGSVRRALDAGWSSAEILDTVRRASRTGLPQPLEYLIADVARRHGQTRIGGATGYIRSDDEALLESMLATRELAILRLRRIASTVLVSAAEPRVIVDVLRDNGFAPIHEGPDGAVVHAAINQRRAVPRRRGAEPSVREVGGTAASVIERLREAEDETARASVAATDGPPIPQSEPVVTTALLREAIADHHGVWIGVTDRLGATTRVLLHPSRVEGGRVYGTDDHGREKSYSLHRLTGATLT